MLKVGTLFSGIGALESALKYMKVNHKIVFACDNGEREIDVDFDEAKKKVMQFKDKYDKKKFVDELYNKFAKKENYVKESYLANYSIDEVDFHQDIRLLDGTDFLYDVDLLVGGSPCQSFSVNGKRRGLDDIRGTLFYDYVRVVLESQPKVFIFENVRGMINHDNKRTWKIVKETFSSMNYKIFINDEDGVEVPYLNSKDYGIPQSRERVFIIGFRDDLEYTKFSFPVKEPLDKTVFDFLEEKVHSKYYLGEKGFKFVTSNPSRARVGSMIMGTQKANQQFNWNGDFIFEKLDDVRNRQDIMKNAFVGTWNEQEGVCRKYTPRECLRLMGFRDDFELIHIDSVMYRQSGNSIVVNVLIKLLQSVFDTGVFKI